jgi:ergothioneine biosynthesis protein EgtB
MATPKLAPESLSLLESRLSGARRETDSIFALLRDGAIYERPIPERHRLVFYLGHLEAFDWNLLGRGALEIPSFHAEFDKLFAFGIDPVDGKLPDDPPSAWPAVDEIQKYNSIVRDAIDARLRAPSGSLPPHIADGSLLHVVIEHRLMHAETLAYLLHALPHDRKRAPEVATNISAAPFKPRTIRVPAGTATLGLSREAGEFGWDNEFERQTVFVPEFNIGEFPVSNGEFLEFVLGGGYEERSFWRDEDWEWKSAEGISHPHFWTRDGNSWEYRGMFAQIPLSLDWPVYVSFAEASAYARWAGRKLPTEAQWHRAAYCTPQGSERQFPWGDEAPSSERGNFDFGRWDASPVGAHPQGASAFGVQDLLGNGWEWTLTPFGPFPGFAAFPFYPGYSANFFDGKHFVMKGGSSRTAACMLRRSFRNWFQPHYPYIYSKFRTVEE